MFAPLYTCPEHGEVWRVERTELIDSDADEVYPVVLCLHCGEEVTPVIHDGHPALYALSEEDMFWETYVEYL